MIGNQCPKCGSLFCCMDAEKVGDIKFWFFQKMKYSYRCMDCGMSWVDIVWVTPYYEKKARGDYL